ncbi:hypothetical protein OAL34_02795 [Synechococcus sp. AH-551-G03]|nr:hypothetical protein [Synechococcus sp. AH-551-G03]
MKLSSLTFLSAGVVAFGLGACSTGPVTEVGPFSETETAFIRSEDGNFTVVKAFLRDGSFIESDHGKTTFEGKLSKGEEGTFTAESEGGKTLNCNSIGEKKAICGGVRYQKSKGDFQFNRKIPFHIEETWKQKFLGRNVYSGIAKKTATIMFDSDTDDLYIGSQKVGEFKFTSPDMFQMKWKTYKIKPGTSGYSEEPVTRDVSCNIKEEIFDKIICNSSWMKDDYNQIDYTTVLEFVDKDDIKPAKG